MGTHPHFPLAEFEARVARLRARMRDADVQVALFDEIEAMAWLSGYGNSENRWRCVGIPLEGEPFFLIRALDATPCRDRSWIADIPTFRDWEDPMPVLAAALPVVLIICQSALQGVDPALERAALVHGCTRWGVFRRVVVPLALPGVLSGALFAFLASFDELVISLFLAGARGQTLPVRIWNSLTLEIEPTIAAVSTLLVAVTILALLLDAVLRRRGQRASSLR